MQRSLRNLLLVCLGALVLIGQGKRVEAQVIYPNQPKKAGQTNKPILSPYLNLMREDTSVNSPYHTFVLPRREIAQEQARQAVEIQSLERKVREQAVPSNRARIPTGRGGHFQQYLHFYSSNGRP